MNNQGESKQYLTSLKRGTTLVTTVNDSFTAGPPIIGAVAKLLKQLIPDVGYSEMSMQYFPHYPDTSEGEQVMHSIMEDKLKPSEIVWGEYAPRYKTTIVGDIAQEMKEDG